MAEDKSAVLLVSHGSPEAESNKQFLMLRDKLREHRPEWRVEAGFTEAAHPLYHDVLNDLLAQGHSPVAVIPFFLFPGGNVSSDIAREINSALEKRPEAHVKCGATLSQQPLFAEVLAEQIPKDAIKAGGTILVVAMAGGVAAENRNKIAEIMTSLHAQSGIETQYGFLDRAEPVISSVLAKAAEAKPESIIVLPGFLFTGIFMRSLRRAVEGFQMSHEKPPVTLLEPFGLNSRMLTALEGMATELFGSGT
jgi:sirohydrochlorin cobaltochelatase